MRKIIFQNLLFISLILVAACNGNKSNVESLKSDTLSYIVSDTAIYGVVGEGTTMHMLELKTDGGKTLNFEMNTEEENNIYGGVYTGDRVTLVFSENASGEKYIDKLVNQTSLLGKWTSLDRNFQILEDGVVESHGSAESHPYTQWSMNNTKLILNTDSFDIVSLGPDSMLLENEKGIFSYKRQK